MESDADGAKLQWIAKKTETRKTKKNKRQSKKIENFSALFSDLKEKQLLAEDDLASLSYTSAPDLAILFCQTKKPPREIWS